MNNKFIPNPIVNQNNIEQYTWADGCFGWHYLHNSKLSVIREEMAPNTSESPHYHKIAQQFFYILNGNADIILEYQLHKLSSGEGIHIPAKQVHKIENNSSENLEFLVISEPLAHGDRIQIAHSNNKTL